MLASGQELSARFVLVRRLGAGGSGSVWLAQDNELRHFVAVKILADDLVQDVAAVAALQRECEHVRELIHPNILAVDALHRSPMHAWLAMQYASGGDLSQLRGRGCAEILRAIVPVASALAFAHGRGVIHRDVKPANVLLMSDGTPRLADFGIALAMAELPGTRAGRGSPFNMSPQQLAGAAAAPADDIYAYGAMLYELLSGYPPFYPDAGNERVRTEKPPSLASSAVPEQIAELIDRCLAKAPADRPASMEVVERELSAVLAMLPAPTILNVSGVPAAHVAPPSVGLPLANVEPLRGEWHRTTVRTRSEAELRRQGFRRGLGAAALVLGLIGIGIVFFALPRWVGEGQPATPARIAAASVPQQVEPEKKELDFAALAKAKQDAEELRSAIDARLLKLRERAVDQWGGAELKQAGDALAAGDKNFAEREYTAAVKQFSSVEPLLTTLEKRASEVLAAQLGAGAKALGEGRSADARTAFELASRIEPRNAAAARGLKRAATLDEVLALVSKAEGLEKEGNVAASLETFQKALALDNEAPRAAAGLARVSARVAGDAFAGAMARGFTALSKADYTAARSAFDAAGKIRPGAAEVAQALKQAEQEDRTRVIATKLETARGMETREQWADALKEYRAVLQLDSTVAFANDGVARTTPRAELNEQLEIYLTQPERLFSAPVRIGARQTLQRAKTTANPGPVLQLQIARLSDWVARADVPVQVALQSDNQTLVTIYRVGQLGAFEQRSLQLAPGSYTVVGTRPGYRDVRREIDVVPGAVLPPVVIRCEDKI